MNFVYPFVFWLFIPFFIYLFQRKKKQGFTQNLRWMVLLLLLITLARPVISQSVTEEKLMAHSIIMALDLSVSMNANDIEPTRAEASRESIKQFLNLEREEQVALLGFTINPLLLSPPTTDRALLKIALANVKSQYILTKGTDIQNLLEKVAKFKDKEKKLILFSDGGDELLDTGFIDFIESEKIKILVIAMATEQGASIELADGKLLQNKEGQIVVSKLNYSLKSVVAQSGGEFVVFTSVEDSLKRITNWLNSQKILEEGLKRQSKHYFELSFIPLSLALIFFLFSATRFSSRLLAFLLFLGMNLQAEEVLTVEEWGEGVGQRETASSYGYLDAYYLQQAYAYYQNKAFEKSLNEVYKIKNRHLEAELLLAHIFYKQEQYKMAKSILRGIKSSDKKIKQQVYYELGNCEAKMLYMERAKKYYIKALQLGEDEDSLHNLKIVLFRQKKHDSKVGYSNPSSAEKANSQSERAESKALEEESNKNESTGGSGGAGDKKSKNARLKIMKSNEERMHKRTLSSKAYELINEGYIQEKHPW